MRIIAGKCRSLQLKTPEGLGTRPTLDRIKETLFNMIQNDLCGAVFVDVFAGSGAIGLEALSRGASRAYFIDNNKDAISCIDHNIKHTKLSDESTLIKNDVFSALSLINEKHVDIIYMDPPYKEGYEEKVLKKLLDYSYVDNDTLIIIEAMLDNDFPVDGYEIIKTKEYKTNKHIFLRRV